MGAALFPIAAGLGILETATSIIGQNRAAQAQRDALELSKDAAALQTQQRLLAIEQKKQFVEGQLRLDNLARQQEQAIAVNQLGMQEQAINLQLQQEALNNQANVGLIQGQQARDTGQLNNQFFVQQQQIAARDALERQGRDLNFVTSNAALELSNESQLAGQTADLRNNLAAIDNRNIEVKSAVANQLDELAQEFQTASAAQRENLRNKAIAAVQLSTGTELSQSDRALLAEQESAMIRNMVEGALRGGRSRDLIREAEKFQLAELQNQRNNAIGDFQNTRLLSDANFGVRRGQIMGENKVRATQADVQNRLANADISLNRQLAQLGIDHNAALQLNLNDVNTQRQLAQLGLDQAAIDVLRTAQANSFELGNAQADLNKNFANLALDANRLSVQSAGAAERANISAQQQAIRSPGALGFLSGMAGGLGQLAGTGILSGIGIPGASPTNPLYNPPSQISYGLSGPSFNTPFTPPFNPNANSVPVPASGELVFSSPDFGNQYQLSGPKFRSF